jgi:SAM-dependent methyltransferase
MQRAFVRAICAADIPNVTSSNQPVVYMLIAKESEMFPLPPPRMRLGGLNYHNDDYYISTALAAVQLLQQHAGLKNGSKLLDFGCGIGRLANGLDRTELQVSYWGVDIREESIAWCLQNMVREGFKFSLSNAQNERYRPKGSKRWVIDIVDETFDVIYAHSVYSHMLSDSTLAYLREFKRLLAPSGRIYLTAFLELNVPDCVENPQGYGSIKWRGRLHCVRYNQNFFISLVNAAGLKVLEVHRATNVHGQSGLLLEAIDDSP